MRPARAGAAVRALGLGAWLACATACGPASAPRAALAPASAAGSAAPATPPVAALSERYTADDRGDAALPEAIARGLGTDESVLSCDRGVRGGVSQFAADWVGVRRFDLNDDGRADWIVNGRHACLRSDAATAHWWIYADEAAGPRLLLRAETAATLEVLATRTLGYRDLRLHLIGANGAALIADDRYDGAVYVASPP